MNPLIIFFHNQLLINLISIGSILTLKANTYVISSNDQDFYQKFDTYNN